MSATTADQDRWAEATQLRLTWWRFRRHRLAVVSLFIIPYQSLKGVTGAGETAPVLGFASFYVMDWEGSNNQKSDQCPDTTWNGVTVPALEKGTVSGTFVETVNFERGPVDPNAICEEGQLIPCRVTLVR